MMHLFKKIIRHILWRKKTAFILQQVNKTLQEKGLIRESIFNPKYVCAIFTILRLFNTLGKIDGFFWISEGPTLYLLARFGPGVGEIVEIGSFKGKSTIWLATGTKHANREKVTAVDPHTGSPEHQKRGRYHFRMPKEGTTFPYFQQNIKKYGVKDRISSLVMTSEEAAKNWNKPIRLLFIDGDHRYEMVEKDYLLWEPHLVNEGIIVFHDVYYDENYYGGPTKLVDTYIKNSDKFTDITRVESMCLARKVK